MKTWALLLIVVVAGCGGQMPESTRAIEAEAPDHVQLSGTVYFEGVVPKHPVRDNAGARNDLLSVNSDNQGLANTMVYLIPEIASSGENVTESGEVNVNQEYFEFIPAVVGVRVGQNVHFTNGDPENHNVRANSEIDQNSFNVMTTSTNDYEKSFQFDPSYAPLTLSCDIHRWMNAWIYVFNNEPFTVTDETGAFTLSNLVPGRYLLVIEQPGGELRADLDVVVSEDSRFTVRFDAESLHGKRPGVIARESNAN